MPLGGRRFPAPAGNVWVNTLAKCLLFWTMQRGVTLLEMLIVLVLLGLLVGMSAPLLTDWSDKLAVMRAGEEVAGFLQRARLLASYRSITVRITVAGESMTVALDSQPESVLARASGPAHRGVLMSASRSVLRFYPNGLGVGASNTKIVLSRGEEAESLTVSRLGRLKRWR